MLVFHWSDGFKEQMLVQPAKCWSLEAYDTVYTVHVYIVWYMHLHVHVHVCITYCSTRAVYMFMYIIYIYMCGCVWTCIICLSLHGHVCSCVLFLTLISTRPSEVAATSEPISMKVLLMYMYNVCTYTCTMYNVPHYTSCKNDACVYMYVYVHVHVHTCTCT